MKSKFGDYFDVVWHGHHENYSPLELLQEETFEDRMFTINTVKTEEETAKQIARRKQLFKKVKGGLSVLPYGVRKAMRHIMETGRDSVQIRDAIRENWKAVMALHAKQCGCGWKPNPDNNIFKYKDKHEKQRPKQAS